MSFYLVQFVTGLASACSLFLVASGLSIIFGVTRIINFAHGAFYMLGAYVAYTAIDRLGPTLGFWPAALLACFVVAAHRRAGRNDAAAPHLRRAGAVPTARHLRRHAGGRRSRADRSGGPTSCSGPARPASRARSIIFGQPFPTYDLLLIALAPVVLIALWLLFRRTRWGVLVRAATQDREMAAALGVNQKWLFTSVFALGVFLAALGGALALPREAASHDDGSLGDRRVARRRRHRRPRQPARRLSRRRAGRRTQRLRHPRAARRLDGARLRRHGRSCWSCGRGGCWASRRRWRRPPSSVAAARWRPLSPRARLGCRGARRARGGAAAGRRRLCAQRRERARRSSRSMRRACISWSAARGWSRSATPPISASAPMARRWRAPALGMAPAIALRRRAGEPRRRGVWLVLRAAQRRALGHADARLRADRLVARVPMDRRHRRRQWLDRRLAVRLPSPRRRASSGSVWSSARLGATALARAAVLAVRLCAARRCATTKRARRRIGLARQPMQWAAFALAGGFAGLAGALYAFLKGSVFPDSLGIPLSRSMASSMVLVGGVDTVAGGVVGAIVFRAMSIWTISHTDHSRLVIGVLIVALVLLFPARPARRASRGCGDERARRRSI